MAELVLLCLLLWVNGIDVHIQLVPAREGLAAVFTGIFKSAREVNGFHVILSVHFLSVHLPTTYCARKFLSLPEMITNHFVSSSKIQTCTKPLNISSSGTSRTVFIVQVERQYL